MVKRYLVFGLTCIVLLLLVLSGGSPPELVKVAYGGISTADHNRFVELDKPFISGPEVTRACLKCHNLAASQVHRSIHWTWECDKEAEKELGKAHVVNNF